MEIKYNSLRDPHLNIFYRYNESNELENNITKAFVNTLESLKPNDFIAFCKKFFKLDIPSIDYSVTFYLQRKPDLKEVKTFPIHNRLLFAFSKTGKCWGYDGLENKDFKVIAQVLSDVEIEDESEKKKYIEETIKEIKEIKKNNGSIPDGWILIRVKNKPYAIIALEDKLYDLNPFQLNNHIEKSLLILEDKQKPIYSTYSLLCDFFKELHSFVPNHFVEYMTILNYYPIDDFALAYSAHEEIRSSLAIQFADQILRLVSDGEIDNRKKNIKRCHVSYDYLRELNLLFNKEHIQLCLSFGSTQNSAKKMIDKVNTVSINDPNFYEYHYGFHLIDTWGKIKSGLYGSESSKWRWENPNEYFKYWKSHYNLLRYSNVEEVIKVYEQLKKDEKIDSGFLEKVREVLSRGKKKFSIVPEFTIVFKWEYKEASVLGVEGFAKSIKEKLNISLYVMKLN